jgi:hypothetical protein
MRVALWLLWLAIVLTGVPWAALLPEAGLSPCQQELCRCEVCAHQKSCCKHHTDAPKIQANCSCDQSPTLYVSPLPLVAFTAKIEITLLYNHQLRTTVVKRAHSFTLCPNPQPPRMA